MSENVFPTNVFCGDSLKTHPPTNFQAEVARREGGSGFYGSRYGVVVRCRHVSCVLGGQNDPGQISAAVSMV